MSLRPPASPNPEDNPRFAAILSKARELAYPKANLEAAIQKVCIEDLKGIYSAEIVSAGTKPP
jgi:transcriptional/translational regulatory protein YebC/TACO1